MPHKSSEVSDMFDIEPRTLFVYESENLIAPERTPTQRRRYSRRDIERIRLIRELTTVHGINLAGVKVIFSLMEAAVQGRLQIPETEFPELAGAPVDADPYLRHQVPAVIDRVDQQHVELLVTRHGAAHVVAQLQPDRLPLR